MSIDRIDKGLPTSDKIEDLNDQTIELDGRTYQAQFNKNEIDALYSGAGFRHQFKRDVDFSASTGAGAWYHWEHIKAESGYSIWKYDYDMDYAHNAANEMYIDDQLLDYKGSATAEDITTFDSIFTYDGSTYTDNTSEAGTEGGIQFTLLTDSTDDYVYIGHASQFSGIRFLFQTRGRGNTIKVEYSQGSSAWRQMTVVDHDLDDEASDFKRDGAITFTLITLTDWAKDTVNSASRFWIRISTTTSPTTNAKAYAILPYESVATLLALSSSEIQKDNWGFCYYNIPGTGSRLYATFRNAGLAAYEGDFYVTSTSTDANKQNFFRLNHIIKANYQDDNYEYTGSGLNVYKANIGDGVNYMDIDGTGVVNLYGTAKRHLTLRADLDYTKITAQGKPTQATVGVVHGYSMPIWNSDDEELFFNESIPGRWDGASDIRFDVLVCLALAETTGETFKFQLSWNQVGTTDVVPATTHDTTCEITVVDGTQYATYRLQFTIDYNVDAGDVIEDHDDLAARLRRVASTGDEVDGEIIVLDWHTHYTVNKMFHVPE